MQKLQSALVEVMKHNHAFQPTYLPPLRVVKSAAEGGRYRAGKSSAHLAG